MSQLVVLLAVIVSVSTALGKANCQYQFDLDKSLVEGTGYKYTDKAGVTGNFTGFKLNKQDQATTPNDLLKDLEISVELMTLDSGNALRDKNLRETLFSGILGDSVAKVKVDEVTKDTLKTTLRLNDKDQKIDFKYKIKKDTLTATGKFDALKFALGEQIAALKKRCNSLHTGPDGKSVTWTEFDLKVTAFLKKTCK